mgnify:FL=1
MSAKDAVDFKDPEIRKELIRTLRHFGDGPPSDADASKLGWSAETLEVFQGMCTVMGDAADCIDVLTEDEP